MADHSRATPRRIAAEVAVLRIAKQRLDKSISIPVTVIAADTASWRVTAMKDDLTTSGIRCSVTPMDVGGVRYSILYKF